MTQSSAPPIPGYVWTSRGMKAVGDGSAIYCTLKDFRENRELWRQEMEGIQQALDDATKSLREAVDQLQLQAQQIERMRNLGYSMMNERPSSQTRTDWDLVAQASTGKKRGIRR